MSISDIAAIAGDILMIGGAIAMIVFVCVSIYILVIVRKVYGLAKTVKSGYEAFQQRASIPVMLITAFLAKQGIDDDEKSSKSI